MAPWLVTDTALPMSWHSDATTTSSSAPAFSASVAVCRQCTSWSTAKPSTTSSNDRSMASTLSANFGYSFVCSETMCCHSASVDVSMRVNVMPYSLLLSPQRGQHVAGRHRPIVGEAAVAVDRREQRERHRRRDGPHHVAQLARRREVLLLGGDGHDLHAVTGGQLLQHLPDQLLRCR